MTNQVQCFARQTQSQIYREEYLFNNSPENRFPTPAIFPKY